MTGPSSWTPKFTVLFCLLENFIFLSASSGDLIFFKDPVNAVTSREHSGKLLVAACALLGVPIVFAGFMGIINRHEKLVRFFLYYMVVCLVVYALYVAGILMDYLPCNDDGAKDVQDPSGHNAPCGSARGLEIAGLALCAGIHLCMVHPFYSFCEELKSEAAGSDVITPAVRKVLGDERKQTFKRLREGPLSSIQGRLVGEYGSFLEAAIGMSGIGNGAQSTQLGPQPPHLPALRLV
mmetsp:Transcript_89469/g.208361  ORF Transcript_89469/g.208361 Transcript_89469/m.208361 type:complete len:237 (-) Transcript_89469:72-782(-)|eukprot:CAMPEP_0171092118 /NCGR_PEP_ID=MMETSP0766_2-20121228/35508_1 /TAXON_ID=439317 /ORGANISM="Gambierdiscus australes, Strain CAWD 149" /LENGTH=236 /DNA_ID=CAMNT_0011550319 /DNA_START=88 /DNA_END=798 /DNA_ORIENTATION=-